MAEMIDKTQSPAALVSVARAAHRTGDRELERAAKRLLLEQYSIRIVFQRAQAAAEDEAQAGDGGNHADISGGHHHE
jgi:hypothetical protein